MAQLVNPLASTGSLIRMNLDTFMPSSYLTDKVSQESDNADLAPNDKDKSRTRKFGKEFVQVLEILGRFSPVNKISYASSKLFWSLPI